MRCVAVIEADRHNIDSAIIWDDGTRLVAFAYHDGRVRMTRPLAATNLDDAIAEASNGFQLTPTATPAPQPRIVTYTGPGSGHRP